MASVRERTRRRRRAAEDEDGKRKKKKKTPAEQLVEFVVIIAVAVGLALLIQAFLVKPYRIPSPSMVPTLAVGQRVLVDRISGHFGTPDRGDILVFHPPKGANGPDGEQCVDGAPPANEPCPRPTSQQSDANYIKRVVAIPGDWLYIKGGRVYLAHSRNGQRPPPSAYVRQSEPFIRSATSCGVGRDDCNLTQPIQVPPDHFFMMGDNRGESDDSREWGPIPESSIIGSAFFTYWPPSRLGGL